MNIAPWAVLALLPLAACNTNPGNGFASTVPQPMPAVVSVSAQDQGFAQQAAGSDLFEFQSSQMALQRTRNPAVRRYAQEMVDGHARRSQALATLASQKGITLPTQLDGTAAQRMAVLDGATRGFDREYLSAQASSHREALQVNQAEAGSGTDPDLKAMAQGSVPMIQDHLRTVQRIRAR